MLGSMCHYCIHMYILIPMPWKQLQIELNFVILTTPLQSATFYNHISTTIIEISGSVNLKKLCLTSKVWFSIQYISLIFFSGHVYLSVLWLVISDISQCKTLWCMASLGNKITQRLSKTLQNFIISVEIL